ncbi:hypothetical protein TCON_1477 [Astathelohania contejeani]|uniref:Ricin B lectin domain-containing protein n=1 Tax=Astathelohania contejeani TaxID=164912 RepID=A0ABQ7HYX5_9MICR|nr:hypothetical protein TCON_1477 [Thelohania contejeani]
MIFANADAHDVILPQEAGISPVLDSSMFLAQSNGVIDFYNVNNINKSNASVKIKKKGKNVFEVKINGTKICYHRNNLTLISCKDYGASDDWIIKKKDGGYKIRNDRNIHNLLVPKKCLTFNKGLYLLDCQTNQQNQLFNISDLNKMLENLSQGKNDNNVNDFNEVSQSSSEEVTNNTSQNNTNNHDYMKTDICTGRSLKCRTKKTVICNVHY